MRAIRTEEKDTTDRPGGRLAEGTLSRGEKGVSGGRASLVLD